MLIDQVRTFSKGPHDHAVAECKENDLTVYYTPRWRVATLVAECEGDLFIQATYVNVHDREHAVAIVEREFKLKLTLIQENN